MLQDQDPGFSAELALAPKLSQAYSALDVRRPGFGPIVACE